MEGTYWLTVLPATDKLVPGIKKAVAEVDRGLKITPQFDFSGARRAGQQAGRDIQEGAESASRGSRFGRMFRMDGARDAGRKGGEDLNKGLESVDVGSGLNKKISQQMSGANATQIGERYGRQLGESASSSARIGLGKLTALLATVGAGAAISSGIKSAVTAGMEFTTNLNTMGAVSNATAAELAQVSEKARQLGSDAELPGVSAQSAAAAMVELAKGGFSAQQAMDAARGSLQLAGAAGVDAAQASTIQSDTLHTFAMNASEAGKAADILAGAANGSSVEINDVALSMAAGGSVAHGLGMNLADTATTIGMFANMGIKGSDAGTSMKTALLQLTSTSKPTVAAFQELGVKAFDAQGNFIGMRGLLDQLSAASKRMTTEQYQQAAATAFGTDGVRFAMLAAQQGTKGFDDMSAAVNRSGTAAEVAAARTKGLPGAWQNFQNQLDGVKLALYDRLQAPLASVLNYTSDAIGKLMPIIERGADRLGAFFTQHAPAIKAFGAAIAQAFSGGGGGMGQTMTQLQTAASSLGPALDRVGPALSTIGKSVASIGSDTITAVAVPALHLLAGALGFIADHAAIIGPTLAGAVVAFAGLKAATTIGGNIKVLGESMRNLFTPITLAATIAQTAALRAHTAALTQFAIAQGTATAEQSAGLLSTIRQAAASTATAIAQRAQAVATGVVTAAQWLWNAALTANPIGLIIAGIAALVAGLVWFFTKTELGRKIWETTWNAIKVSATTVWGWMKTAWQAVSTAFSATWEAIKTGVTTAWTTVEDKFNAIVAFVKGLPGKIAGAATGMWDGLKNGLKAVLNEVASLWNGLADKLSFDVPSWVPGIGGQKWSLPHIQGFAAGRDGRVRGPGNGTSDSILARISNGEGIVKTAAMDAGGSHLVAALNAGWVPSPDFLRGMFYGIPGHAEGLNAGADYLRSTIMRVWPAITSIGGRRSEDGYGEHSSGNAIDVMIPNYQTPQGKSLGDSVASWLVANKDAIGLNGMIWRQTSFGYGGSFTDGKPMSDRGSDTQNHMDHVHVMLGAGRGAGAPAVDKPSSTLSMPSGMGSGGGSASALGAATGGGGYRAATSDQLDASSHRVDAANTALKNADQSVEDHKWRVEQAQKRLDEAKAKGKDTTAAQHSLDVANRELQDATERQAKAKDRAAKTQEDDNVLRTQGVKDARKKGEGGGSGTNFGDLGKDLFGGVLESFGLDGSLFSNPLEWPTVKSLLAGVNFFGGLLSGGNGSESTGSSLAAGLGDGDGGGLGAMLGGITSGLGLSGFGGDSSALAEAPGAGDLNPATGAVASSSPSAPGVANADPAAARGGTGAIDNSINVNGNVGMDPTSVVNKVTGLQDHRTRTTRVWRA